MPDDFRIPTRHKEALTQLAKLSDSDFEEVAHRLADLPSFLPSAELRTRASEMLGVDHDMAEALVRATMALCTQQKYHGWTAAGLGQLVADSRDMDFAADLRPVVAARIARLIQMPAISSTARAADIQTEHAKVFHDARVFSDVRPIFGDDPSVAPDGAVINEVLKIEFFEAGELGEVYVALDRHDLLRLARLIERALTKTDTLRGVLEASGLTYFELGGRHDGVT